MNQAILTFDVGGHGGRAGLVDADTGLLLRQADVSVDRLASGLEPVSAFSDLLSLASAEALDGEAPGRIVIAAPGPVSDGIVENLPTLFGGAKARVDLTRMAHGLWPASRVWSCNDLTAAGYGFVAQGHRDFLVLTCGSGIGGKLFSGGRPMLGPRGMGGEIGHWRVEGMPELPCDCGGRGHLGGLASGRGTLRLARFRARQDMRGYARSALAAMAPDPEVLTARLLAEHFHAGDTWAEAIIAEAAAAIGGALALIHLATATETFFITGGFGTALGPRFGLMIGEAARARSWATGIDWASAVHVAEQGVEWGLIGAAHYALTDPGAGRSLAA